MRGAPPPTFGENRDDQRRAALGNLNIASLHKGCALETDGGEMWQLDVAGSAWRYLGRRVTVGGKRSGFDLLNVHRIMLADFEDWLRSVGIDRELMTAAAR